AGVAGWQRDLLLRLCSFPRVARATAPLSSLSLHDALPIFDIADQSACKHIRVAVRVEVVERVDLFADAKDRDLFLIDERSDARVDRKSTRLNSSHVKISYAVFCLKKKNINYKEVHLPSCTQ